ncbi:hypothetical protein HED34_03220 [Vagococcus fluvialis]|uniref:hypothetical protein n=1 Tax=Vagococcus fluvialis TaxID=2738 RepID=UPI0014333F82|nr:hypothetical protein [Vagococcus fluvialis]NKC58971.1 hypothetical protein [Vagococcus fluvialis]NKD49726.1 hypothetical protein [Vagococcus fluvialis]
MNKEKEEVFNILKKSVEPKSLENLIFRVKNIDDLLKLGIALLVSYGGKYDDINFLSMMEVTA